VIDEDAPPLGWVPLAGRGTLPFALVHGESLVAAASWAVGEAGAQLFDASVGFDQVRDSGRALLVHDPLCPLTPADFLARAWELSAETGTVVIGFRAVTDTIKELDGDLLGATRDRSTLRTVLSPVVVPPAVLTALDGIDVDGDLAGFVERLAATTPITWLEAPALAGRITSTDDLRVLEALSRTQARDQR
jgi:2-C-methyl-D-erythritol 4-phosphate cytidylyltransferase